MPSNNKILDVIRIYQILITATHHTFAGPFLAAGNIENNAVSFIHIELINVAGINGHILWRHFHFFSALWLGLQLVIFTDVLSTICHCKASFIVCLSHIIVSNKAFKYRYLHVLSISGMNMRLCS